MTQREPATWHPTEEHLWSWGDWFIAEEADGFHLLVSSGVTYGPFNTLDLAKQCAENVRGD